MRITKHLVEVSFKKLNSLNQRIWDEGFTTETLSDLSLIAKEVYNGTTLFERIPQKQQSGLSRGSSLLCAAAIICRGCPGTESETREIYRTDDLLGEGRVQEALVEQWARIVGVGLMMRASICLLCLRRLIMGRKVRCFSMLLIDLFVSLSR